LSPSQNAVCRFARFSGRATKITAVAVRCCNKHVDWRRGQACHNGVSLPTLTDRFSVAAQQIVVRYLENLAKS
jgi:hypothetical protein